MEPLSAVLKFAQDIALEELVVEACGCLGNCGNGPNVAVVPTGGGEPKLCRHVATPADLCQVLQLAAGVEVAPALIKATELRLAGNALVGEGDLEGALARYSEALALAPPRGAHALHSNAAAACLQLGRPDEALAHAQAAVATAPVGFHNAPLRLIDALYALGRYGDAAAALDAAVARHPRFRDLPEHAVVVQALRKRKARA